MCLNLRTALFWVIMQQVAVTLMFIGPCIVIYSYSKTNKMHLFLKLFNLVKHSTCFGGLSVHHQELKTVYTETGICLLLYIQS